MPSSEPELGFDLEDGELGNLFMDSANNQAPHLGLPVFSETLVPGEESKPQNCLQTLYNEGGTTVATNISQDFQEDRKNVSGLYVGDKTWKNNPRRKAA